MNNSAPNRTGSIEGLHPDRIPSASRDAAIFIGGILAAYMLAWVFSAITPIEKCPPSRPIVHASYPTID